MSDCLSPRTIIPLTFEIEDENGAGGALCRSVFQLEASRQLFFLKAQGVSDQGHHPKHPGPSPGRRIRDTRPKRSPTKAAHHTLAGDLPAQRRLVNIEPRYNIAPLPGQIAGVTGSIPIVSTIQSSQTARFRYDSEWGVSAGISGHALPGFWSLRAFAHFGGDFWRFVSASKNSVPGSRD